MSIRADNLKKSKLFVGYLTAGFPDLEQSYAAALAIIDGGVDVLEIGVPFSDPIADGSVISQAMQRVLLNNISLTDVLLLIKQIKSARDVTIVLFSYFNPLLQYGLERFMHVAVTNNIDGLLIVDLPFEENQALRQHCVKHNIDLITLLAPASCHERIQQLTQHASGFIYYVCHNGITGVRNQLPSDYAAQIARIKSVTTIPVVSGFGIGDRATAHAAVNVSDGFVVGSAFIKAIANGATPQDLKILAQSIDPR